jgi:hypothetical protein
MLYVAVRLVANRPIAATASLFLLWQGWHWILSRFYYQYAGDLAWISTTTALMIAGLRSERRSLVAAAGFTAALGVTWLKTAAMAAPWAVVLVVENLVSERRGRHASLHAGLVWGVAFTICMMPFAAQVLRQPEALWHYTEVAKVREQELKKKGLSSIEGYAEALQGAMRVLQVRDAKRTRHSVRPDRPALDLIQSAMATVGFLWCLWKFRREKAARVALLGFVLFLLPAVRSYPSGGDAGVNRRMAGASFFVAWMAALGASTVATKLAPIGWRFPLMLGVASSSLVLNVHAIRTVYNRQPFLWYDDMGVHRTHVIRALRQAAEIGPVFFRPTYFSFLATYGVKDLPNVVAVQNVGEVRDGLAKNAGKMCTILLPWSTTIDRNDTPEWIEQLSDVVPPFYWQFGPPDLLGVPIYRIAYFLPPKPQTPR